MKKLLGVLLVAVMSWPANATVLKNVEVVGEIQTIASDVRHQVQDDLYNSGAWTRAMAGLSADLVEDVTANLMFQYAYMWGTNNEDNAGFGAGDDEKVKLVNANVVLHNLFCAFDVTVGRQFYGDEDSAVMYFGPNHYNAEAGAYAQAIDAAKLTYADDVKSFTFVAGRVADLAYNDPYAPGYIRVTDSALFGADFKLNVLENLTAQVYGYDVRNAEAYDEDGVLAHEDHSGFYGAKLAANMEAFRLSAEYARNFAGHRLVKESKNEGQMFKADIAADIKAVTARGTFLYANENFYALGNYTPGLLVGHALGGNIWEYSNDGVRMFNLGFDVKPFEKWTMSLDGFVFQGSRGHHAGTLEADLTAKYQHNEYVELFAGIGYAKYGTESRKGANTSDFTKSAMERADNVKGQLGMLIKF